MPRFCLLHTELTLIGCHGSRIANLKSGQRSSKTSSHTCQPRPLLDCTWVPRCNEAEEEWTNSPHVTAAGRECVLCR